MICRPRYFRQVCSRLLCPFLLAAFTPSLAVSAEIIDLKNGVRTWLYGDRYNGYPPNGDFYGWAMTFGDIDGDGYTDFLSSAGNSDGPNDEHGPSQDVYLIFGGPRSEIDSVYAVDKPGGADIVFYGCGFAMACADIDNDGYDDALLAQNNIYVVYGAPRKKLRSVYDFHQNYAGYTPPDIRITGGVHLGGLVFLPLADRSALVSEALVSGDINGDHYADIIFGDIYSGNPAESNLDGAVFVVLGRPRNKMPHVVDVNYATDLPHPDVAFYGDSGERYSSHLAVGDMDGDRIDDLFVKLGGSGEFNLARGEVHCYWGRKEWKSVYRSQTDDFDFALDGDGSYRLLLGDVDADGRDDLILGAIPLSPWILERRYMGTYQIVFGRARSEWPKWSRAQDVTDVLILGANTVYGTYQQGFLRFSFSLSMSVGSRDQDPYHDLLVTAGYASRPDGGPAGAAYLLKGRPRSEWPAFIDLRDGYDTVIYGADYPPSPGYQLDNLGYASGMADFDGNGFDEIFVAAPFADGPGNTIPDCGEAYVIYDSETSTATAPPKTPYVARSALLPNSPNPFRDSTALRFTAAPGDIVELTIYDALGREVAAPLAPTPVSGSEGEVRWAGLDNEGRKLPAGVYFLKMRSGRETHSRKVTLVR